MVPPAGGPGWATSSDSSGDRDRWPFIRRLLFHRGLSDFVVQVDGTCLAVTSPNVIEVATGEAVSMEERWHTRPLRSERAKSIRQWKPPRRPTRPSAKFLSYLPSNAWSRAPRANPSPRVHNPALSEIVPQDRRKSYDIRDLIGAITDESSFFELGGGFARSLRTGLGHRRPPGWNPRESTGIGCRDDQPRCVPEGDPTAGVVRFIRHPDRVAAGHPWVHGRNEG